ncbi:hypothetical protein PoB_001225400 [Plakobranchus ocellatus]|uniref:DUF7869 domain-containing protein n=1 Tax=Plakobranchus ocellatus TaxID=259542 RepID=A0AAV3YVI9_9GAST|nr:hypothetical protein PoB_001225400 [Plakobranchus ocellatus]
MADENDAPVLTDRPKKRKSVGRQRDIAKKARVSNHVLGEDCNCSRFQCFQATTDEERQALINVFNALESKDSQNSFLSTLIKVESVARRRPRHELEDRAKPKDRSYAYIVKVQREGGAKSVPVCLKGFCAMFGITHRRVRTIQTALKETGFPPQDRRGKHQNRPSKLSGEQVERVIAHIQSFKGRSSHYSRNKSKRIYLPDELNITKMFELFQQQHPAETLSYESYRVIFNNRFNISFGFPRSDTCSLCDQINAKLTCLDSKLQSGSGETAALEQERAQVNTEKEIHHRKAEVFYERKKAARVKSSQDPTTLAVAFDYQKELPLPNKTTNDIFYRRQLSVHSFNIHELAGENVFIYVYNETVAKRGSDDVASLLHHFFSNYVPAEVKHLELFSDGCAGQNKNWTIVRFLFAQVHFWKRFETIKWSFPVRGHSYMECDRDLSMVNKRRQAETQQHWVEEFQSARKRPSPFNTIEMGQGDFFSYTDEAKYKDLQVLKKFCDPQNAVYYDSLPHDGQIADDLHQDLSESDEDGTNS